LYLGRAPPLPPPDGSLSGDMVTQRHLHAWRDKRTVGRREETRRGRWDSTVSHRLGVIDGWMALSRQLQKMEEEADDLVDDVETNGKGGGTTDGVIGAKETEVL
jgi:hypothetical protein